MSVDYTCGQLPLAVNFDAARSFSPAGSIASYAWDFDGDGVIDDTTVNPNHVYTAVGVYPANVTVTDNAGLTNTALVQITVNPGDGRPAAAFTLSAPYGPQLLTVDFDASNSADYDGVIVSYDWDFGDGNVASGITTSHTFAQKGSFPVTLTVTDNNSLTSATQKVIEVGLPEVSDIGDLSDDGRVDFVDYAILANYWNIWEPTVDIVADGITDYTDLVVISNNWMLGVPVPHQEPVAWYTLDGNVLDSSGFDHHGTIYGNPFYTPGYDATANGALSFDANGDYVNVGNWNPSEGLNTLSVAFWAKWDGPITDADQQIIAKRDSWAQNMMWQITIKKNVNTLEITQGNGIDGMSIAEFGVTMPVDTWTHIAVTYDGTDAVLYVNGANPVSRPFTLGRGTFAPITIGSALQSAAPAGAFQGDLDEVRIYDRPLTESEVQILANTN